MTDADDRPVHFLGAAPDSAAAEQLYADDLQTVGFVMNGSRVWAHAPQLHDLLFDLLGEATAVAGLTFRQRGVLVTATAAELGDSYCALAWGMKLAEAAGPEVAVAGLTGDGEPLDPAEQALARWARALVRNPNGTRPQDVEALRQHGFSDPQILAVTVYVAGRLAFSTVNDGLGVRPDHELADRVPDPVRRVVTAGRPVADAPS